MIVPTKECVSCGVEHSHVDTNVVGPIRDESHMEALFSHVGTIAWVCPICSDEIGPVAREIGRRLNDIEGNLYWPSIMKLGSK